jgi:hypothetical protein
VELPTVHGFASEIVSLAGMRWGGGELNLSYFAASLPSQEPPRCVSVVTFVGACSRGKEALRSGQAIELVLWSK